VYTPPSDAGPVSYDWSWCPFAGPADSGRPCLVTEEQLAMLGGGGAAPPSFSLGTEPTATLTHAVPAAALAAICSGMLAGVPQVPDCEGGFPVQVKLTVSTPTDKLTSVRILRLRFDPADIAMANTNPHVDGLGARLDDQLQPIADDPAVTLPRRKDTPVEAVVPETVAEPYMGKDEMGQPIATRERLVLSWFVETGDTSPGRSTFIDGELPFEDALTTKWKPGKTKDYAPDTARVVVVIRDDRGGVGWRSGVVSLGGSP
jgi:hypothetical protein